MFSEKLKSRVSFFSVYTVNRSSSGNDEQLTAVVAVLGNKADTTDNLASAVAARGREGVRDGGREGLCG